MFSRGVKLGEIGGGIKRHKLSVINKSQGYDTEHKEYMVNSVLTASYEDRWVVTRFIMVTVL